MKFTLHDGALAHLNGIVQTRDYRRDYVEQPPNVEEELKRIAQMLLPDSMWRSAPMILLHPSGASLAELMAHKKFPPVMCIGEFVSYRPRDGKLTPSFLRVVWLQHKFIQHMAEESEQLFLNLTWLEA